MQINNRLLSGLINSNQLPGNDQAFQHLKSRSTDKEPTKPLAFVLKPDIDTYKSSFLTEDRDVFNRLWEEANKANDNDNFGLYGSVQHLVFSQKLHEIGFFDGMSADEKNKFKHLLQDITRGMDSIHPPSAYQILFNPELPPKSKDYGDVFNMYSDEAKIDLESAASALKYFSDKDVDKAHQEEFNSLIDDFHSHNGKYLENYQSFEEKMVKASRKMIASGLLERENGFGDMISQEMAAYSGYMGSITHTEKETDTYLKNMSAMFKQLQQTGANSSDVWKDLKEEHLNYLTKGTKHQNIRNREWERAEPAFRRMEDYWKKLVGY